jgi:hypothetical protein
LGLNELSAIFEVSFRYFVLLWIDLTTY